MNFRSFLILCIFSFCCLPSLSSSAEIEWKLYLKSTGPILTTQTSAGQAFVIDAGEIDVSGDIIETLDGTSFMLMQSPVTEKLTLHIILYSTGNSFETIQGVPLCFNMKIEAYVNNQRIDDENLFRNSPLVLTIPAINYLTQISNCKRTEICFGYYSGGDFEQDGIETVLQVSSITTYINRLSVVVGGKNTDLGFSSNVSYSTWYKIKKLFE